MWDETNVNPKVAALLSDQHREFYGFPIRQGVGVLQAFDDATDRANEISLTQLLWRDGCEQAGRPEQSITCRAELIEWALRYGLSKGIMRDWRTDDAHMQPPSFLAAWRARWPRGLAIPNPDIPNRNPFRYVAVSEFPGLREVEATALEGKEPRSSFRGMHEPTQPREPLEIWAIPATPQTLERVLATFVQFFSRADLDRLERVIRAKPERLHQALSDLAQDTLMGRTDVFANQPFRRVTLLAALDRQLGSPAIARCCLDVRGMPQPVDDEVASHHSTDVAHEASPDGKHKTFYQYCGACHHHGAEGFPPNFLHGSPAEVEANLAQCADRIFVRLSMWDIAGPQQLEAPMPPTMHLLRHRIGLDEWKSHSDLQVLRKEAVAAIQRKRGASFPPENLLGQDYDSLPACQAPRHEPTEAMGARPGYVND
jgi:cytochrome c5